MKSRILKFLSSENKTSAQFAEEIGVQPSGVSHILSGRNNPSLDFVMKMLHRYPALSTEWLLFGREPMYKRTQNPTLFDDLEPDEPAIASSDEKTSGSSAISPELMTEVVNHPQGPEIDDNDLKYAKLDKIVFFYADRSFHVYSAG